MNWWSILEISYDSDIKTIKKAYSKLLKINNPEDNPEGYQRLREAYDAAVKYAKKNNKNNEGRNNNLDIKTTNQEKISRDNGFALGNYINEDKQIKINHILDIDGKYNDVNVTKLNVNNEIMQFLNKLNDIYSDLSLRSNPAVWEELLNSAILWDVEAFSILEEEIFDFLTTHKYLPEEIWIKLNNNFTWSQNEIKLYSKYPDSEVDEFLNNLKEPSKLNYDFIKSINPEIVDKYLYERDQTEKALRDKKFAKAYNHLKNANSLFEGDPELLRLEANYKYIKKANMKEKIHENMTFISKHLIKVIILIVIFYGLRHSAVFKSSNNYNNTENNNTENNITDEDIDNGNINVEKTILNPNINISISMHLTNVKQTKYYKISEPFENNSVFSNVELDEKGLRDKVESQLYVGSTDKNVIIFADSKFNDKTLDNNGGYELSGTMCPMDKEIGDEIMKEYDSDYQGFDWISNGFIDASKEENSKK